MANELTKIPKFRRCVLQNFPFIEQDFDALTDYQLLCKVVEYLNKVITSQNEVIEVAESLTVAFNQLQSFVENYFENLDVQEEINNKLDDMVEQGTLQEIITAYIQANVAWTFDTVAEMKQATNLVAGSYAQTLGFHTLNDGGGAIYKISDSGTANEMDVIAIDSLYATIVLPTVLTPEQVGCYGNGTTDDTTAFARACTLSKRVEGKGTYLLGITSFENVSIKADIKHNGNSGITLNDNVSYEGNYTLTSSSSGNRGFLVKGKNIKIKNTTFNATVASTIAIDVFHSASNVIIKDCLFKPAFKIDIFSSGNDMIIEGCLFEEHTAVTLSPVSEYGNGIKLSQNSYDTAYDGNGNNIVIRNNTIYEHGDNPIDCFTGASNVVIDGNYLYSVNHTNVEIKVYDGEYGNEPSYNYIITNNRMVGARNIIIRTTDQQVDFYNFIVSNNILRNTAANASCLIIEGTFNYSVTGCIFDGDGTGSGINITNATSLPNVHIIDNCTFNNFAFAFNQSGDSYAKIYVNNCKVDNTTSFIRVYTHMEVFVSNCDINCSGYISVNTQGKIHVINSRLHGNYLFAMVSSDAVCYLDGCVLEDETYVFIRDAGTTKFKYAIIACDLSNSTSLGSMVTETVALATAS